MMLLLFEIIRVISSKMNVEIAKNALNDGDYCKEKPFSDLQEVTSGNLPSSVTKAYYACKQNMKRVDGTESAIFFYSCTFQNIHGNNMLEGGAIFLTTRGGYPKNTYKPIEIDNCLFEDCSASIAGAIYISTLQIVRGFNITNCRFNNNQAASTGGAIYFAANNGAIENCTFMNNVAQKGTSLYYKSNTYQSHTEYLTVQNNKFVQNKTAGTEMQSIVFLEWEFNILHFNNNKILIENVNDLYLFDITVKYNKNPTTSTLTFESNCISSMAKVTNSTILKTLVDNADFTDQCEFKPYECPAKTSGTVDDLSTKPSSYKKNSIIYGCKLNIENRINSDQHIVHLYHCTFNGLKDSSSKGGGGAIYIYTTSKGPLEKKSHIDHCTFTNCQSTKGGAISIKTAQITRYFNITNSKFENNKASGNGGSIYFNGVYSTIEFCEFNNNQAGGEGSEIYFLCGEDIGGPNNYNPLLIQNSKFKLTEKHTNEMIYLNWTTKSDFAFKNNEVIIKESNSNFFVGFTGNISVGTMTFESNCISPSKSYLCDTSNTELYSKLKAGFPVICGNSTESLECQDGYYLQVTPTLQCLPCNVECETCDYTNFIQYCKTCAKGYREKGPGYNDIEGEVECEKCEEGCLSCPYSKDRCEQCHSNYFMVNKHCYKCEYPCETCYYDFTNCTSCVAGYYYISNLFKCKKCISNCDICMNDEDCINCSDGFFLYNKICQKCHETCKKCHDFTNKCDQCIEGYYKNEFGVCEKCSEHCVQCTSTRCTQCEQNFFLNEKGICTTCVDKCEQCIGTPYNCTKCVDGFYLQLSTCMPCDPNCKTCEQKSNKCLSCAKGKFFQEEGNICIDCMPNCKMCDNADICLECADNSYNPDTTPIRSCSVCEPKCASCGYDYFMSYQYCKSCGVGYRERGPGSNGFVDEVVCEKCVDNCLSCPESADKCKQCKPNYLLINGKCKLCDSNCATCQGELSNCTTCNSGYFLKVENNVGKCIPCGINCDVCTDINYCAICSDGYYSDRGKCKECNPICKKCHDDSIYCDSCAEGYHLNFENQCVRCSENCAECTQTECILCESHYYLNDEGKCVQCLDICLQCQGSPENCIECPIGSYLSETLHVCIECDQSCKSCRGPGATNCIECADGYYLLNDGYSVDVPTCIMCEPGCASCIKEYECDRCSDGFYMVDSNHNSDKDCKRCAVGCKRCTNSDTCLECEEGFYASSNADSETCIRCPSNCNKCQTKGNSFVCIECNDGYYLDENQCVQCIVPCKTCKSPGTICMSCIEGHLLKDYSCSTECSPLCATCEEMIDKCTSCNNGYMLIENTCNKCEEGCSTCEYNKGVKSCTSCQDGYAMDSNNKCIKCDSSCSTCMYEYGRQYCYDCASGYFKYESYAPIYNGVCRACNSTKGTENCIECTSNCYDQWSCEFICTRCADGFYLKNNQCNRCHSSCESCYESGSDKCNKCSEGYYEYQGKCTQCNPACFGCDSTGMCTSCRSHKYLTNGKCYECAESCAECENTANYCTDCNNHQFAFNGKCYQSCVQVGDGYGSMDCKTCEKCNLEHCIKYDDSCQCQNCTDGYTVITDYSTEQQIEICVECALDNCKLCNGIEKNDCVECKSGHFLFYDQNTQQKLCLKCQSENCIACSSNGLNCYECDENHHVDSNGDCVLATETPTELITETPTELITETPTELITETPTELITETPTELITETPTELITETPTELITETPTELITETPTELITETPTELITKTPTYGNIEGCEIQEGEDCVKCLDGYYEHLSNCFPCHETCKTCYNREGGDIYDFDCLTCYDGYYIWDVAPVGDTESGYCSPCPMNNCSKCHIENYKQENEIVICDQCETKFFYNNIDNSCKPCHESCLTCSGELSNCTSCNRGYFLKVDNNVGKCTSCGANCDVCTDIQYCAICSDGYYSDRGKCKELITETPTELITETPTELITETPTELITETPTELITETPTELITETPTELITKTPTELITETPTELITESISDEIKSMQISSISEMQTGITKEETFTDSFGTDETASLEFSVSKEPMTKTSTREFSAATQIESASTKMPTDFVTDITMHSTETGDLISKNTIENTPSSDTIKTPFSTSFKPASQNLAIPDGANTKNRGNKMTIIIVIVVVLIAAIIASVVVIVALKLRKNRNLNSNETSDHKSATQDITRNTPSNIIEQVQDNSDRDLDFWL